MSDKKLLAALREETGSGSAKKMRREKLVPGIVYSKGEDTKHVQVDQIDFIKVFRIVGTSSLMELEVDGEVLPVIVKTVQRDPVKGEVIHIDFQKLDMKQKIKITVPVYLLHRDSIKLQPSVLMQMLDTIEIECLPGDIPESVGIDVSGMDFETPLYVKDLDIMNEEHVEVLSDPEAIICTLNEPTMEEEEEEEEVEDAMSVPVVGEEDEE
ncbi:50S ribosomal protein L25 [Gudongella sp. SC589]|jgi:large subunit ribosomal protein L25|uniref:50S ribosomal protein L25 n=1 Tax=Gudongella sp. SC589 TaxID=3385990 RepID=UPI003904D49A